MKAIISNKIYMVVEPSLHKALEKELTYKVPSYNEPDQFVTIKNLKVINFNITGGKMLVAFPIGRMDLIPKEYTIEDKRAHNYIEDFPEFKYDLRPSQQEIVDDIQDNCIINAKVGFGKAQPKGSLVRIPGGWKPIEDVLVGDEIVTPTGDTSTVVGKFEHKNKPIYKLTFSDGRSVEACEDHLWGTINGNNKYKVLSTKDILQSTFFKNKRMYVPLCSPINDTNNTALPIHPYVLGVILGDGGITHGTIKVSSADIEIINRIRSFLPPGHYIEKIPSAKYEYIITSDIGKPNEVLNSLRDLGLQGCNSFSKFIPKEYIFTSLENKLFLLQGLLDTDGSVNKGNGIMYYTISPKLSESVAEIVRSLGGICTIGLKKSPKYTYKDEVKYGQDCYVLNLQRLPLELKKQLFSLPRKLDLISAGQYDNSGKLRIDKIEYVGDKDCWCIAIDSIDKLYITNQYIVTHNTFSALALASKLKQKTLVVTHTVALRNQWEKEVIKTLGIKPGVIGSGKFNIDSPVVVSNVQTLVKYIPRINREFGLVIMDEMHHVSSPTFSKVIDAMFSRYKVGLSGTIERKDQKHVVFKDYFGTKIYKPERENTMTPTIDVINSGIEFPSSTNSWAEKVNALKESHLYKNLVIGLADYYSRKGHKVLIVSDRVEFLRECSANSEEPAELLIGALSEDEREKVIKRVSSGEATQLWATQSLVSEGISINPLSCLILATPLNNMPLLEQLIGRIQRNAEGKLNPVVVDIKLEGWTVKNQFNNRLGHYMKEGYEINFIK